MTTEPAGPVFLAIKDLYCEPQTCMKPVLSCSGNSASSSDALFDHYMVVNPTCLRSSQDLSWRKQACVVLKQDRKMFGLLTVMQGTVKYPSAMLTAYKGNSKIIQAHHSGGVSKATGKGLQQMCHGKLYHSHPSWPPLPER